MLIINWKVRHHRSENNAASCESRVRYLGTVHVIEGTHCYLHSQQDISAPLQSNSALLLLEVIQDDLDVVGGLTEVGDDSNGALGNLTSHATHTR